MSGVHDPQQQVLCAGKDHEEWRAQAWALGPASSDHPLPSGSPEVPPRSTGDPKSGAKGLALLSLFLAQVPCRNYEVPPHDYVPFLSLLMPLLVWVSVRTQNQEILGKMPS